MRLQVNTLKFNSLLEIINKNVSKLIEIFKLKMVYLKIITGKGLEFDRLREYTPTDDANSIDWNATARTTQPYVKIFKEERMLDVILLFDVSNTMLLGTTPLTKNEYASVIAGILGYTAINSGDKLGLIMFSDRIKFILDPSQSMDNYYSMLRLLSQPKYYGGVKNWSCLPKVLLETFSPDTVLFIISDFVKTPPQMFDDLQKFPWFRKGAYRKDMIERNPPFGTIPVPELLPLVRNLCRSTGTTGIQVPQFFGPLEWDVFTDMLARWIWMGGFRPGGLFQDFFPMGRGYSWGTGVWTAVQKIGGTVIPECGIIWTVDSWTSTEFISRIAKPV